MERYATSNVKLAAHYLGVWIGLRHYAHAATGELREGYGRLMAMAWMQTECYSAQARVELRGLA